MMNEPLTYKKHLVTDVGGNSYIKCFIGSICFISLIS